MRADLSGTFGSTWGGSPNLFECGAVGCGTVFEIANRRFTLPGFPIFMKGRPHMRILPVLALVSVAAFSPVFSWADEAPAAAPVTQAAPSDPAQGPVAPMPVSTANAGSSVNLDEIECRSSPPPTGTRLGGGRECHTVREWNKREQDSRDALIRAQQTGYSSAGH